MRSEIGEKWEYADIGYDILATIIERVSGQTYEKFIKSLRDELPMGKTYSHSGGHPEFSTNYYRYPDKKMTLIVCRNVEQKVSFGPFF